MANILENNCRAYNQNPNIAKRYIRVEEAVDMFNKPEDELIAYASAAGAIIRLVRTTLISVRKLEEYMKHLYKVPGSGKYIEKKYVRIGEGSITYSIGHHRFIEMARAAGAVYKIGDSQGGTVLINLEIFDEYMEQFREEPVPMKHPLWKEGE